jgi:four helix bundle protein
MLPPGRAGLRDQLDRASTSVVANIAEGAGEFSRPEKARFYRIARRSATEVVAWLDITRRRNEGDRPILDEAMALYEAIVAMLVRLIKAIRS